MHLYFAKNYAIIIIEKGAIKTVSPSYVMKVTESLGRLGGHFFVSKNAIRIETMIAIIIRTILSISKSLNRLPSSPSLSPFLED